MRKAAVSVFCHGYRKDIMNTEKKIGYNSTDSEIQEYMLSQK